MPLYEYKCENCGDVFEVMQKFVDEPLTIHEKCGGKVDRLISAPSLQFKGSGFYITDYGKSGSKSAENGSAHKSDSTTGKSAGSGDSGSNASPASSSSSEGKSEGKSSSSDSKSTSSSSSTSGSSESK